MKIGREVEVVEDPFHPEGVADPVYEQTSDANLLSTYLAFELVKPGEYTLRVVAVLYVLLLLQQNETIILETPSDSVDFKTTLRKLNKTV